MKPAQWKKLYEWMLVGMVEFDRRDDRILAANTLALLLNGAQRYKGVNPRDVWERCDDQLK